MAATSSSLLILSLKERSHNVARFEPFRWTGWRKGAPHFLYRLRAMRKVSGAKSNIDRLWLGKAELI